MESTYVALLRGINVGGKNRLPMNELAAMFEASGCRAVRTYIQSGNVVFDAEPKVAKALPAGIAAAIQKQFGLGIPVILRSAEELTATFHQNPFLPAIEGPPAGAGLAAEKRFHVMFLSAQPSAEGLAKLDPERGHPDKYIVQGKDIYLHIATGADTKLTNAYFDSRLGVVSTIRNWRTVTVLAGMVAGTG